LNKAIARSFPVNNKKRIKHKASRDASFRDVENGLGEDQGFSGVRGKRVLKKEKAYLNSHAL
jgi:hypothetical protein